MIEIIKPLLIGLAVIVGIIGGFIYKGKQDNPVEEVAEVVIYSQTGLDIDLTPTSPER